jgi:hypothetical protein
VYKPQESWVELMPSSAVALHLVHHVAVRVGHGWWLREFACDGW